MTKMTKIAIKVLNKINDIKDILILYLVSSDLIEINKECNQNYYIFR